MDGARVLITGASRGIGRAVAVRLAREGYDVIGTALPEETVEAPPEGVELMRMTLNDEASIDACVKKAGQIDILINNAGVSQIGPVEEVPVDRLKTLFQTNFFGTVRLTRAFLPGMRQRGRGIIINIGSMAGRFHVPFQSAYVASKSALAGWSGSLRHEVVNHGIKVILIEPNDIRTAIEPELVLKPGSDYEKDVRTMKGVRDANMAKAPGPEVVADHIVKIIKKKHPKPAYAVGGLGPLFVFLKRFLPDRAVERLVRGNYHLN